MHLGSERPDEQRADSMLPDLVSQLRSQGYGFSTVEQTEWARQKQPENGN